MIKYFVKFLYSKIFFVISGLFIVIGSAVALTPITATHAATVNCPPQIQEGATNTVAVNELHSALQSHYNSGDLKNGQPDNFQATSGGAFGGGFGPDTRLAVVDYQSQHGLGADGIVGPLTWGSLLGVACGSDPSSNPNNNSTTSSNSTIGTGNNLPAPGTCFPNISAGTTDSQTTTNLQNILISKGYPVGSSGADGQFGPNTTSAVEAFQRAANIGVDGSVGPLTWKALGYCSTGKDEYGNNSSSTSTSSNTSTSSSSSSSSTSSSSSSTSSSKSTTVTCSSSQVPVKDNNGTVIDCISIQSTLAYTYCQDGNSVYQQHGMQSAEADCSQASNIDAQVVCDYGYWKDANELTITGTSISPSGDQQKDQAAADQACNSVYTG